MASQTYTHRPADVRRVLIGGTIMRTLDEWLRRWGTGDRSARAWKGLLKAVCEYTGVSREVLADSGDPTGWDLARRSLHPSLSEPGDAAPRCRMALGLTWDARVPVLLTWGYSAPHREPPAPPDRTYATAPGVSQRTTMYVATRAGARSPNDRIDVGHLWLLRFARPSDDSPTDTTTV